MNIRNKETDKSHMEERNRYMAKATKRLFEKEEDMNKAVRINKYLSDSGVCSRREADGYIEKGQVLIDGEVAVMGSKVLPGQKVTFKGKELLKDQNLALIAFNKPRGIVCTTDRREPDNIIDYIGYNKRIYPIGRLDKDSEGLILLTNDGNIVNKILRAGNNHEKEYIVKVNKAITMRFVNGMSEGVPILDTVTKPCKIEVLDRTTFRITLTQGLNRQIRRMCEYFEYRVISLQRVRIMNIHLGHLQLGGYRNVTDQELQTLRELIEESSNMPMGVDVDDEYDMPRNMVKKSQAKKAIHTNGKKIMTKKMQKNKNFAGGASVAGQKKEYGNRTSSSGRASSERSSYVKASEGRNGSSERRYAGSRPSQGRKPYAGKNR